MYTLSLPLRVSLTQDNQIAPHMSEHVEGLLEGTEEQDVSGAGVSGGRGQGLLQAAQQVTSCVGQHTRPLQLPPPPTKQVGYS